MPQLDKISFINQLFWFFLCYFCFYFLLLKTFLPTIGFTLKLRFKLLKKLDNNSQQQVKEISNKIITRTLNLISLIKSVIDEAIEEGDMSVLDKVKYRIRNDIRIYKMKMIYVDESKRIQVEKMIIKK
jgi:hypothetical protein